MIGLFKELILLGKEVLANSSVGILTAVQHDPDVTGNHVHSMLRDLSFDWLDPLAVHQRVCHAN